MEYILLFSVGRYSFGFRAIVGAIIVSSGSIWR